MPVQNIDLNPITAIDYNGTSLTQVIYDGYEVWPNMLYPRPYYGVEMPEVQWVMSAQGGVSITGSTAIDLSNGADTVYTGDWISSNNSNINFYTNSSGVVKYYFPLAWGANLKTTAPTSSNSDIINNGGYTFWITFIPWSTTNAWSRLWSYYNLATSTGSNTSIGNTHEYSGPLLFLNRTSNQVQYYRPTSSGNGDYSIFSGTIASDINNVCTYIIRTDSSGLTHRWVRNGTYSRSGQEMPFGLTGAIGGNNIRTGQNTATPVFADAFYNNTSFNGVMESGFANRLFTDAECLTLVDGLNDEFKR